MAFMGCIIFYRRRLGGYMQMWSYTIIPKYHTWPPLSAAMLVSKDFAYSSLTPVTCTCLNPYSALNGSNTVCVCA